MPKTKKKLFALLVAVDKYQPDVEVIPKCRFGALSGCENDAQKMLKYLTDEESFDVKPIFLTNEDATKKKVVNAFETHLSQAEAGDVVLFYYSGHGIQEYTETGVWVEETDGKLECLVCYNKENEPCLLADKELRYLLGRVAKGTQSAPKKESPHILTIFDCCHAGENTRNGYMTAPTVRERRIKCVAPSRDWSDFVFDKKIGKEAFQNQHLS